MKIFVLIGVLALTGCEHSEATQVRGPDGSDNWVSISCTHDPAVCYQRAGEVCPNGYQVADQESRSEGSVGVQGSVGMVPWAWGVVRNRYRKDMLIRCNSAPVMPKEQPEQASHRTDRLDADQVRGDIGQ